MLYSPYDNIKILFYGREVYTMNFDIKQAKQLIKTFGNLNAENQEALLAEASRLEIEQGIKEQVVKAGKPMTKLNIDEARENFIERVEPFMENWDNLDPNQLAVLAISLNEITKGELTKEESIEFVVSSRQLSISEYIEKYIPGADYDEAKRLYKLIKTQK